MYLGKSNGVNDALVAEGPHGPVTAMLSSPTANTAQVTGKLYRRDGVGTNFEVLKFAVDSGQPTELHLAPLAAGEVFYLTLDAAPTSNLTIQSW